MLHEESCRCACAADAQGFANLRGLYHHLRHKATFVGEPIGANPCHLAIFCALAERLAMAGVPSELVEDLENDFPRLMERQRCKICRGLFQGDGYTHAAGAKLCQRCATETMDDSATVFTTP